MKPTILVVEDDYEIASIIRDHLQSKGFHVTVATTGIEGFQDFERGLFDLVIVDIMLPELSGFELCQRIRLKSQVPLLILSAKMSNDDKVRGLNIGADDYMTKPFSLHELTARVQAQIRKHSRYREKYKQKRMLFGADYVVDHQANQLFFQNEEVSLTPKEFEILLLFVKNPNKMFAKKEIYRLVWHEDCDDEQTVTVHMKGLRDKLNEDKKNPKYIETVWGSGYRFIGEVKYEN
ncbi:response regulator transcription factor [Geomicrobium sediminis]|uniref:DNA-binding response OmpR family regulator n=1 Tax=Geomicrobium sediminis TaxID=1347788 RepID=A0ABS2P841_9BACL|nr:response regulator transcription factor [Geomicrobium sediminis]MBM7631569.1 DNA-binding response OmpR family regulator [Geomicrobium sediminis]